MTTILNMRETDAIKMFDKWPDGVHPDHKKASFQSLEAKGLVKRGDGRSKWGQSGQDWWSLTEAGRALVHDMKLASCWP